MDLDTIKDLWPMLVALVSIAGGYAILQFRSKQDTLRIDKLEIRLVDAENRLEAGMSSLRKDMMGTFEKLTAHSEGDIQRYMDMERDEHVKIINRFENETNKLGARFEIGLDRLSQKIDRLVEYNMQKNK